MNFNSGTSMGQRLRELREAAGLSLRDVAKAANISAPFLSDVELGRRFPSQDTLVMIAQKLRATPDELKKHDYRSALVELKRLTEASPSLGAAVRAIVEEIQSGKLTTDELAAKLLGTNKTK